MFPGKGGNHGLIIEIFPMNSAPHPSDTSSPAAGGRSRYLRLLVGLLTIWALAAYLMVPWISKRYFQHHLKFTDAPRVTQTADDHPGDPLNIALVGTEEELFHAMTAIGWYPADPITFRSSIRIVVDSLFHKPDDDAPVSNLYLLGHTQNFAFEQPVGKSPRQRHHVRFWRWNQREDGRPDWIGSATFDRSVGLSHTTGQITHHIGPDVDAERDRFVSELEKADWAQQVRWVNGFHKLLEGRNGGGDRWHTDGRLAVVELRQNPVMILDGTNTTQQKSKTVGGKIPKIL